MSPYTKQIAEVYECECNRCLYRWFSFTVPTYCAGCKSRLWDSPRVRKLRSPGAIRQEKWRKRVKAKARAVKRAARILPPAVAEAKAQGWTELRGPRKGNGGTFWTGRPPKGSAEGFYWRCDLVPASRQSSGAVVPGSEEKDPNL